MGFRPLIALSISTAIGTGMFIASAPGGANTLEIKTPGQTVEATFPEQTLDGLADLIAGGCLDRGWSIVDRDAYSVTCSDGELGWSNMGSRLRTEEQARFSIVRRGSIVAVAGSAITISTNGLGAKSQTSGILGKDMLDLLDELGGDFPAGTVFKGNDLGVFGREVSVKWSKSPYLVRKVVAGSAASDAGIQPGDLIKKVNGKTIDGSDELGWKIAKLKQGQTFTLLIERDGNELPLSVEARAR